MSLAGPCSFAKSYRSKDRCCGHNWPLGSNYIEFLSESLLSAHSLNNIPSPSQRHCLTVVGPVRCPALPGPRRATRSLPSTPPPPRPPPSGPGTGGLRWRKAAAGRPMGVACRAARPYWARGRGRWREDRLRSKWANRLHIIVRFS